jgi:hypothetical protein
LQDGHRGRTEGREFALGPQVVLVVEQGERHWERVS